MLHLYNELNATQINELKVRCSVHQDKRFQILAYLLSKPIEKNDELLLLLRERIDFYWPNSSDNELKFRRLSMFIAAQFELVIMDTYLQKESSAKNELLAKAVAKNGNLLLMEHYSNKMLQEGKKNQ